MCALCDLGEACCFFLSTRKSGSPFEGLQAAVAADARVQRQLVQLLLCTSLPAAVRAVVATEGRRQPGFHPSEFLENTNLALRACCLQPEVERQLHVPRQQAEVLRLAATAVKGLPLTCPEGVRCEKFVDTWVAAISVLQLSCTEWTTNRGPTVPALSQQQEAAVRASLAAWTVLSVLPRLADALRALHSYGGLSGKDINAVCRRLVLIFHASAHADSIRTAQQVATYLAAADAGLRLLPLLQQWWQSAQPCSQAEGQEGAAAAATGRQVTAAAAAAAAAEGPQGAAAAAAAATAAQGQQAGED